MTAQLLPTTFDATSLSTLPSDCPASRGTTEPTTKETAEQVVWVRGCLKCGELDLSSFWGSAVLAKLVETRCRHCLATEMAVCPVSMPSA